jgi:hypothetical protein
MGFIDRLFGRRKNGPAGASGRNELVDGGHRNEPVDDAVEGFTVLAGTTTTCRDAILALVARHGVGDAGHLELSGSLQREPGNPADPNAVAVMVEGERVGYLPGHVIDVADLPTIGSLAVRVQIFTEMRPKGLRAEAWAWLGNKPPQWEWSATNRPPMSSKAKAMASHDGSREMVRDALADGGARAQEFKRGMVNGVHYLELVEPIKQLKRENRLEEALELCFAAIQGAEASRAGREPAPFYTEQAAIILRKLGRRNEEIAVLQRWLKLCPPERRDGSRIGERLAKLTA